MHDGARKAVAGLLAAADQALPAGYSAVLYGSAVRGDYVAGRSDINLLLVSTEVVPERLRALGPALRAWRKASYEPPLIFTAGEWARATDVFPIEIMDMRGRYEVLRGADPVAQALVNPTDLRQALESEFRGKVLRLRQAYATHADVERDLTPIARSTTSSILVLLRATLRLMNHAAPAADSSGDVVRTAAAAIGFDPSALLEVVARRDDRGWRCPAAVFEGYVAAVSRAAQQVDQLQTGES